MSGRRNLVAALLLALTVTVADEGRVFVYRSANTPIVEPGYYVLTRDLSLGLAEEIHIQASHVTLDLRGYEVSKPRSNGEVLVRISADATEVSILNGRLSGGSIGIQYAWTEPAPRARLRIERVEITDSLTTGIDLQGIEHVDLLSCRAVDTGGTGVHLDGMTDTFGGRVVGNTVLRPGSDGIVLDGLSNGEVRGNLVRDHGATLAESAGIRLSGVVPIQAGGNRVVANGVHGGGSNDDGIVLATDAGDNMLLRNTVSGNGRRGIHVASDGNHLEGNVVADNLDAGILVDGADSTLHGNQVIGNQANGITVAGDRTLVEHNLSEGNRLFGLEFMSNGAGAYRGNMLRDNLSGAVGQWWNATDAGGNFN